jgi:hypothetical protein
MHRTMPHSEHQSVRRHKLDRHRVVAIERRYGSSNELISDRVVRHHGSGSSAFYFERSSVFRLAANQTREQVQPVDTPSLLLLFASRAPSPTTTAVEKVDNQIQWCAALGNVQGIEKGTISNLIPLRTIVARQRLTTQWCPLRCTTHPPWKRPLSRKLPAPYRL